MLDDKKANLESEGKLDMTWATCIKNIIARVM